MAFLAADVHQLDEAWENMKENVLKFKKKFWRTFKYLKKLLSTAEKEGNESRRNKQTIEENNNYF